jgi:hypothetical protein
MSQTVRSATDTPVKASISTPVFPWVFTCTVASMYPSPSVKSHVTPPTGIGWHMGMIRDVSLTAIVAATRAVARTLPLTTVPSRIARRVSSLR